MPKIKFSMPRGNFPRLCLIGNSNVGKSSLTKLMLSHPQWYKGKVGKTAGSTVRLTIINDPALKYHVVDLPGFGRMVRLSKSEEASVQSQILKYIELDRKNIFLMLLIVSADRLGEELEKWYFRSQDTVPLTVEFLQFLQKNQVPTALVVNKVDKLNRYQKEKVMADLKRVLHDFQLIHDKDDSTSPSVKIFETSITTMVGIPELKAHILQLAQAIDLSQFDSRESLFDQKPIDHVGRNKLPDSAPSLPPNSSSLSKANPTKTTATFAPNHPSKNRKKSAKKTHKSKSSKGRSKKKNHSMG